MDNLHEKVYSDEILHFVNLCNQFSNLLSPGDIPERADFTNQLLRIIPQMYSALLEIDVGEAIFEEENEKFVSEEEWSSIYQHVSVIMGSQNEYLDIPADKDYDQGELITRAISEDLADVYQDIRNFLELYRNGTEEMMNDALWECRMNFETYWGEKILRASLALHRVMVKTEDEIGQRDHEWGERESKRQHNTGDWIISKRQKDFGGEGEF